MTARVITDPSALGWVLDPDTGRWEWSGSGDGGGAGGGGGAWELVENLSGVDVSAFELELNPDEFHAYRFFVDIMPSASKAQMWMELGSEGEWLTESDYITEYCAQTKGNFESDTRKTRQWRLVYSDNVAYQYSSHWEIKLTGLGFYANDYVRPAISYLGGGGGSSSTALFWLGSGSFLHRGAPIDKVRLYPNSSITWTGSVALEGMRSEP